MIKFLTVLLSVFDRLFAYFDQQHWKRQGRQETIEEMNDELTRQTEAAEAADTTPDPARDEWLRSRFDRSRASK